MDSIEQQFYALSRFNRKVPDTRLAAHFTGNQCERLAEKLAAIFGEQNSMVSDLRAMAMHFVSGEFDKHAEVLFNTPEHAAAALAADCNMIRDTVLASGAMGANVPSAFKMVAATDPELDSTHFAPFLHATMQRNGS